MSAKDPDNEVEVDYERWAKSFKVPGDRWHAPSEAGLKSAFLDSLDFVSRKHGLKLSRTGGAEKCLLFFSLELLNSLGIDFKTTLRAIRLRITQQHLPREALIQAARQLKKEERVKVLVDKMVEDSRRRRHGRDRCLAHQKEYKARLARINRARCGGVITPRPRYDDSEEQDDSDDQDNSDEHENSDDREDSEDW